MGFTIQRSFGVAALAATTLVLAACGSSAAEDTATADSGSGDTQTLVFASIPSEESQSLQQEYQLIAEVIEKETGNKVEFQNATDYAAVIEAQRAGKVQIAAYGPFSYVTAKDTGVETTPIASLVDAPDETPGYQSYAIVKSGSPIRSLADYRGKTICFVDPGSTSGYLYPSAGLEEAGIDPATDVTPVFAGGHDASVLAVMSGQCDAGFAYDSMVDQTMVSKGQIKPGDLDVLWKSETIAGSPVAISDSLSPELREQITSIFQTILNRPALVEKGYCTDEASCKLPENTDFGYVAVDDASFDGVRKVCEITQAEACKS
ncbi:phosphate/phosphite/phosphonate ABC transporter substrate-binding protein [Rhodococcus gannanensis]|uniref:Phosphate/phosphite/phosphonate ABC transporter substrate-binding protein n=1 Tax=Rhodococcus gannanensis TaxID=1960308 RepID=A0ABW4P374_9NOCA